MLDFLMFENHPNFLTQIKISPTHSPICSTYFNFDNAQNL